MDNVTCLEIVATILTLIGIPIISIPRLIGMWILIVATIFWIIFAYTTNHNYFLLQNIYVFLFDCYAIYSWKKKGIK